MIEENLIDRNLIDKITEPIGLLLYKQLDEKSISEKTSLLLAKRMGILTTLEAKAEYGVDLLEILNESQTEAEIIQKYRNYLRSKM